MQSFFGTGGDVEQTEGGRGKQTRQSRENRCSGWSVYFAEDICEQLSMVHWQIDLVTYLRDTSQASRWRTKKKSTPSGMDLSNKLSISRMNELEIQFYRVYVSTRGSRLCIWHDTADIPSCVSIHQCSSHLTRPYPGRPPLMARHI